EPVRVDVPVDAYVPGDYVPYEAAKIEIHRRVAGAREVAELIMLREELEDRFGPVPDPLENLIKLQDARIKMGRAGARTVDFRAALAALVAIASGCGNDVPSNGVAKVGGTTITKATFNHWLAAAARQQSQGQPGQSAQAAVPDPPNFTNCIAEKQNQPVPKGA